MNDVIWYKELGFFNNPFSIKPAVFHNELFGNSEAISKIIEKVKESGVFFISGEFGTGKTTVLKKLISEFRGGSLGEKKVIYYNCNRSDKSIDYDRMLIGANGFFGRLFGIRRKNMFILLDEMQDMNKKDLRLVKEYYDNGFFSSVVFVGTGEDLEMTEELSYLIDGNKFKLSNMTEAEAVEMVRRRIGNLKFISDEMIVKIFDEDNNSRSFLKNCEDVCRFAFESEDVFVTEEHVAEVLKK